MILSLKSLNSYYPNIGVLFSMKPRYFFIMETETWKPIIGYEGSYEVSNLWNVRSLIFRNKQSIIHRIKILRPKNHTWWYKQIILYKGNKDKTLFIHRLVYSAFIWFKDSKMDINHKNWLKYDNRIDNLEECTRSYNIIHSYKVLKRKSPRNMLWRKWADNPSSKKVIQLTLQWEFIKIFDSITLAWESIWLKRPNIWAVLSGKRKTAWWYKWKYFTNGME